MNTEMSKRAAALRGEGRTMREIAQALAAEFDGKVRSVSRVGQLVARGRRLQEPDPEGLNQLTVRSRNALFAVGLDTRAAILRRALSSRGLRKIPNFGHKSLLEVHAWLGLEVSPDDMTPMEYIKHLIAERKAKRITSGLMAALAYDRGVRDGARRAKLQ